MRASGFTPEIVELTKKGPGSSYSHLSRTVHSFEREMAEAALETLKLKGQLLWDEIFRLACVEADAEENDVSTSL